MIKDLRNVYFPQEDEDLINFIKENKNDKKEVLFKKILLEFLVTISNGVLLEIKRLHGIKKDKGTWEDGLDVDEALR